MKNFIINKKKTAQLKHAKDLKATSYKIYDRKYSVNI